MHVFTYTDARNNLKSVLDKVIDDVDVAFITRKEGGHAVVMGQDHYDSLMETLYLLSSPNNASRLNESIAQLRAKPEPLKANLSGFWSRRIDEKHRLVYEVTDERISIIQCRFHY